MLPQETLSYCDVNHAIHVLGARESRVSTVVSSLAFHQCDPGSTPYVVCVLFGSLLCSERVFFWILRLPPLTKSQRLILFVIQFDL